MSAAKHERFVQAVAQGDLTFAKQLIAVATVSAFTQGDANGKQPLHCACEAGHLHVAQWLLEQGAAHGVTVGAVDGKKGQPMHYACRRGHIELAQWLQSQGAALDARDKFGRQPIHLACTGGQLQMVQWLHERSIALDVQTMAGDTPLSCAEKWKMHEVAGWIRAHAGDATAPVGDPAIGASAPAPAAALAAPNSRVLITGASGFIGSALVAKLIAAGGHDVVAISRSPLRAAQQLGLQDDRVFDWDSLSDALDLNVTAVVHLAGESVQGLWVGDKQGRVSESRLTCTKLLVDAIRKAANPPSVVVSASGIGFYGEGGEAILDESASSGDDFFAKLCVQWESIVSELKTIKSSCRVSMLRLGIVVGPDGGALKAMLLPTRLGIAGPLGTGQQWWSWVALADATSAIMFALTNEAIDGPVNVVAPAPIRQNDFQQALSRAVSRPSFLPAPAFALRAVLGTFAEEVLSSKRVVPAKLSEAGFQWQYGELAEAIRASV